jgi:two-component system KDP operon response regulator KdpE
MDARAIPLLLVEDEPDLREALEEYLQACGFVVTAVGTAAEALAAAGIGDPRIVLTDLSLPDRRGDLFLEEFHRRWPQVLLYVHSGDSAFVPSRLMMDWGLTGDHVFAKPCDLSVMVAQFRADLSRA